MSALNRRWGKILSLPALLAACGLFLVAAFAGISAASEATTTTTSSTTSTETSPPTPTTPPTGEEGCTPGFWKTHPDEYPAPYKPTDTLGSVFPSLVGTAYANLTLDQALSLGGGGVEALLRQAVAALLNAASDEVAYPLTTTEVINLTNDAIASGNAAVIEELKDQFDEFNNLTAPGFCDQNGHLTARRGPN